MRAARISGACQTLLTHIPLKVNATGIEEGPDWAIVKIDGSYSQEQVVSEGEELAGCYRLVSVRKNSIVVLNVKTDEQREFFISGYSNAPLVFAPKQSNSNEESGNREMENCKVHKVSDLVDRLEYPLSSNFAHLPKLIYHNRAGSSFYGNYEAMGLGERAPIETTPDASSHVQGVRVNKPSDKSFFGSLGFTDGQKIIAINGQAVKTPQEVGRLLEERRDAPVSIGYYDPETRMILSEHALIRSH